MIVENYNIIVCDNEDKIKNMIDYFKKFIKIKNNKLIGIDFEFNRIKSERKIALFQINLESDNDKIIYLFYPPHLNAKQIKLLKKLLYNETVILHGGESLDIPYLFSEIFTKSNEKIKFLKKIKDTKFLCEYYNIINNYTDYKCKIYSLLFQMNVINKDKFDYLQENENKMGFISQIIINVKKMKKELILYALYDVLYLPRLLKSFPDNNTFNKIIPDITRIVLLSKEYNYIEDRLKILNTFNNYFILRNNNIILFNDFYKKVLDNIENNILLTLLNINYFKKFITTIIKLSVYIYITNNNKYYFANRDKKLTVKLKPFKTYIKIFKYFENGYQFLENIDKISKTIISY